MGKVVSPRLLGFVLPHFSSHATLHLIAQYMIGLSPNGGRQKQRRRRMRNLRGMRNMRISNLKRTYSRCKTVVHLIVSLLDFARGIPLLQAWLNHILSLWYPWSGRISALPMLGGWKRVSARMREEWILRNSVSSEGRDRMLDAELHNLGTLSRSPTPVSQCNTLEQKTPK